MSEKKEYIELGTCKKPHGIKGEFSFYLFNTDSRLLKKGSTVWLQALDSTSSLSDTYQDFKISKIKVGNKTICSLEGISDRNQVEAMIPFRIMFPRESFPKLSAGEFYFCDLPGLIVKEQDGSDFGMVENYYENNGQLILVIKKTNSEKLELPHIENFFPETNVLEGFIIINAPEEI